VGLAGHAASHTTELNTLLTRILGETISLEDSGLLFETFRHDDKYSAL
jgi:hypothetical protein